MAYQIFTLEKNPPFQDGTEVTEFALPNAGITIPAVLVGERGGGRELGVLPVQLSPEQYREWEKRGGRITIAAASVGQTCTGKPTLCASPEENLSAEYVICVLRTKIGFRGGNDHTGDRLNEWWTIDRDSRSAAEEAGVPLKEQYTADEVRKYSSPLMNVRFGEGDWYWDAGFDKHFEFAPFPGEILARGVIAQGDAGRMGRGEQLVALVPKGAVWRTDYYGRLYGAPDHHCHIWTGEQILSATKEERELADLF